MYGIRRSGRERKETARLGTFDKDGSGSGSDETTEDSEDNKKKSKKREQGSVSVSLFWSINSTLSHTIMGIPGKIKNNKLHIVTDIKLRMDTKVPMKKKMK